MTCSFLELDGSTDSTIKTRRDVLTLLRENNLPVPSYIIETSKGHFHILWNYSRPLPWTTKGESYFLAQQKRLIQLFQKAGFNVDVGASLNPTQNLRNPSQLQPYNYKRRCRIEIHKSYKKTSLRSLYKALNSTNIQNPRPLPASTKLRRYLRQNKTFTLTLAERFNSDFGKRVENIGRTVRGEKNDPVLDSIKKKFSKGESISSGESSRLLLHSMMENKTMIVTGFPSLPVCSNLLLLPKCSKSVRSKNHAAACQLPSCAALCITARLT